MSDDLPGWTCPDIDEVIKILKRGHKEVLTKGALEQGIKIMEELRASNTQLRNRCRQLLNKDVK